MTDSASAARRFTAEVDAAAVLVNASSRFVDGGEFGFGAEIGISTQKLHARGPMGLPEMTTTKYVVTGSGQIRDRPGRDRPGPRTGGFRYCAAMNLALTLLEAEAARELPVDAWVFGLIAFGLLMGLLVLTWSIGKGRPHS